jgi:hypothetical protein
MWGLLQSIQAPIGPLVPATLHLSILAPRSQQAQGVAAALPNYLHRPTYPPMISRS